MGFAVFIHRPDSAYADEPARHYQFPKMYLSRVLPAVGGWVVYYEPTKVRGTRGYYAVAKLADVVKDGRADGRYLARIEPGTYLEFANPVPFVLEDGRAERGVSNAEGRPSGRAQSAVRPLSSDDFARIVSRGLTEDSLLLPRWNDAVDAGTANTFDETQDPFVFEQDRIRVETLTSRTLRDRVFRKIVLRAYDERCAVTGLKLINGGGRAEVEAAHIRPVEKGGPDIVANGVALSGTAHWMFDRGLIGFADNHEIMVSRQVNDRDGVETLLNRTGRLIVPVSSRDKPHPAFLRWHRDNVFKV
ncbi:MAG: restriction endonuclease [Hyphomicrobiales bacterium]|nr:MAG: restriction endonuclease [Hyphomicrobiales bacterium]